MVMALNRQQIRAEREALREQREAMREGRDRFNLNIDREGPVNRDFGIGQDEVMIKSGPAVSQIRLTIGRAEVGNGNPNEGTAPGQDGGLAARIQAENGAGALFGPVSRFDDEGITFRTKSDDVKFDIRDLTTGAPSGDTFDVAVLGTSGADVYDFSGEDEFYYVHGGLGDDRIIGGEGNDHPVGGGGNDFLAGNGGDDLFVGGFGNDRIEGGAGNDTSVHAIAVDGADSVDLGTGLDTVRLISGPGQIRLTFSALEIGNGNVNDAGALANQDGGLAVRLQAENGSGGLIGPVSRFDDEGIIFTALNPAVTFDVRELLDGFERGNQYQYVQLGTSANDLFDNSASTLRGFIAGGQGDDQLIGGTVADALAGGDGNDRLDGRGGDDTLVGRGGSDTFVFTGAPGSDAILDFVSGTDRIDLSAYGIDIGDVQTSTTQGGNTLVRVDINNDGVADFTIVLVQAGQPQANDYIF
jgi:Ca2+-binding RTX toxin-like protein